MHHETGRSEAWREESRGERGETSRAGAFEEAPGEPIAVGLRSGGALAFEEAVRRYAPRVRAVAWRMLGNDDDADDAVQEVFLRLYRTRRRLDPRRDPLPWLYRVTVNVCSTMLRRRARHRAVAGDAGTVLRAAARETGVDRELTAAEARIVLQAALRDLTPRERAALILRDLVGLSSPEVASVLRCRPGTVRGYLARARLKVRDALGGAAGEGP